LLKFVVVWEKVGYLTFIGERGAKEFVEI